MKIFLIQLVKRLDVIVTGSVTDGMKTFQFLSQTQSVRETNKVHNQERVSATLDMNCMKLVYLSREPPLFFFF